MLRSLRNQTQSIFFKAFLFLLIIGFALWGVGDLTGGLNQKPILSVNSKEVTSEEIINELNRLRYTLPQRPSLQEAINNGMLKTVLDKYEQEILINAEASFFHSTCFGVHQHGRPSNATTASIHHPTPSRGDMLLQLAATACISLPSRGVATTRPTSTQGRVGPSRVRIEGHNPY